MIIDTHAHLNDPSLVERVDEIVDSFKANNIESCIIAGFNYNSSLLGSELADKYNLYAIIGTHPEDIMEVCDKTIEKYLELSKNPKVVGVGEIGLDYHYDNNPPRDKQIEAFKAQIIMANEAKLPICLHVRDAYGDTLQVLKDMKAYLNNGILLHCYSGSAEMIREFNVFGCYYALGGAITFKNAKK